MADVEKPSDASHEWRSPNVMASVASSKFCVKSSKGHCQTSGGQQGQVDVWLKQGVSDDAVQRLNKPIRYQAKRNPATQALLMIDSAPSDEQ